jgi:uncharacterized SAM-binding protein YcdF (DUF218 family)
LKILDILVEAFIELWEVKDEIPERTDGLVGIGTGLKNDGTCSPQSDSITRRCLYFTRKFIAARRKIIFTSGNSWGGPREAEAMADLAIDFGTPKESIIVEAESKNTRQNAIEVKKILLDKSRFKEKPEKILVVCDRIHSRKTRACFKKVLNPLAFKVYIAKAYAVHDPTLPRKRLRSKARFFLWELLSYAFFRFKGWI